MADPRGLSVVALPGIPLIRPGDDLAAVVLAALAEAGLALAPGDVLVVAQKIVSKAEGRFVDLRTVAPGPRALELAAATGKDPRVVELILRESTEVVRHRPGVIVVAHRLGLVMANAGIDASNVDPAAGAERVLLLPEDPDRSAAALRAALRARTGVDAGVIVSDSFGRAWRNGTIGTAIGASGVAGLLDLRGRPDLFGRALQATEIGLADELAAAASVVMGQADEGRPAVLIRGVPYPPREGSGRELIRPRERDMFR